MAATASPASPPQKNKTLHVVVFDVSGSMKAPLKLRWNSRDANKNSRELGHKRVQTVFDIICRLAEDGISEAKDQDGYAAVLCFGLRHVTTCDLLAFLEDRTKTLELLESAGSQATTELPHQQIVELLTDNGIHSACVSDFLRKLPSDHLSSKGQQLYTVVGREPLVQLLARKGAPYCEKYVEKHMTPEAAGKYFMLFAVPQRDKDLNKIVVSLPNACKHKYTGLKTEATRVSAAGLVGVVAGIVGQALVPIPLAGCVIGPLAAKGTHSASGQMVNDAEQSAVDEATQFADDLIAAKDKEDTLALLKSTPIATPRTLRSIIQLVKRLQTMLKEDKERDETTYERPASLEDSLPTFVNWERLLDDIEPYLYGRTPMCKALQSAQPIFHDQAYSSKVMMLISDGDSTDGNPRASAQAICDASGTIFSCLLTDSAIEEPRRLCGPDEADSKWPDTVHVMFDMASTVSCNSRAVQALRRRGWALPLSGQCKLFIQANNPMIIDEFTTASKEMGTSCDALAEILGQISLDNYIQKSNKDAKVTNQGPRSICWAHSTASVLHLASSRVEGRQVAKFLDIRTHLLTFFGDNDNGQRVDTVLSKICPLYRLRYEEGDEIGARAAIHSRRPVIATFWLDGNHWNKFVTFYQVTPQGTLTAQNMNAALGGEGGGGHAVVLVRCDNTSLTFMNSWGPGFANKGFFTVDRASTLEISGGPPMRFYDIYWTTDDLSTEEVKSWKEYQKRTGEKLIGVLPKSYHDLPVKCPHCKQSVPAKNYDGAWYEAICRACNGKFQPTGKALIQSLYNSNYS